MKANSVLTGEIKEDSDVVQFTEPDQPNVLLFNGDFYVMIISPSHAHTQINFCFESNDFARGILLPVIPSLNPTKWLIPILKG